MILRRSGRLQKSWAEWRERLRLPPRRLLYVAADGEVQPYRLRFQLDGSLRLHRAAGPGGGRIIVACDPALPLRRLFRFNFKHRLTRQLLLATAADAFPGEAQPLHLALGGKDGRSYVFGFSDDLLEELRRRAGAMPRAVLVAESDPASLAHAVEGWLRAARVRDALGAPPAIAPARALLVALVTILAGASLAVVALASSRLDERFEARRALEHQTEARAGELLRKRRALAEMGVAYKAVHDLYATPGTRALAVLNQVLRAVPEGTWIDEVDFQDQELRISGWGESPEEWLPGGEGAYTALDVNPLPEKDRFSVVLPLARAEQAGGPTEAPRPAPRD